MSAQLREHAQIILHQALRAVDPGYLFKKNVHRENHILYVLNQKIDLASIRRLFIIGAGKGSAPLALAVEELLADRLEAGAIIVKVGHGLPLSRIRVYTGGHPLVDETSIHATRQILSLCTNLTSADLVLVLVTGGGSALLELPPPGISLEALQKVNELLLACGAEIHETNTVRKHLSLVKGGQLLRWLQPAQVITLAISDVIGDVPEAIASGPTVPDNTTFSDAWQVVAKYGLLNRLPEGARDYLQSGLTNGVPDTPKPGDTLFHRASFHLLGNNQNLLTAASIAAERLGYQPVIVSNQLRGEAYRQGYQLAALLENSKPPQAKPLCLLIGGETTVTLRGSGLGGRNQELALAAALKMAGRTGELLLTAGSDGSDGPTTAAGALVEGTTRQRARDLGLDAEDFLIRNDSHTFFKALGDLINTGPTRTNVMDLIIMLKASGV